MNNEKKESTKAQKNGHHFMHSVLDSDRKKNPMPREAAASILRRILEFFTHHKSVGRRNDNGEK